MIKCTMKILICSILKYEVLHQIALKYCSINLTFNNAFVYVIYTQMET